MSGEEIQRWQDRDLSWLAFNERVLLEAMDSALPALDRLTFLGIVASNLDEFFRVRVARLRCLGRLARKDRPRGVRRLLRQVLDRAQRQQIQLGRTLRGEVLPQLATAGIRLVDETEVAPRHYPALRRYFAETLRPMLHPCALRPGEGEVFLDDRSLYLAVAHCAPDEGGRHDYEPSWSLVEVPSATVPRFVALPALEAGEDHQVIFLDDVIRMHLPELFPGVTVVGAYALKLARDADLHLGEELGGELADRIRRSLVKRRTGMPSRFHFDGAAPYALVAALENALELEHEDLVPGWRYHHLADLMRFPDFGRGDLRAAPLPPHPHPVLDAESSPFESIAAGDQLLQLPYQAFSSVLRFLTAAAADPDVSAIWISLYRVAANSAVAEALVAAARAGKRVTAFVELQARFDEETNLVWSDRMREAGVRVLTSHEGIKVHAKIALVERQEGSHVRRYGFLGTGNFNEQTARVYADLGLFTAREEITTEVRQVFDLLEQPYAWPPFVHLLVAPADLRGRFIGLIRYEVAEARAGRPAWLVLKLNALEDPEMIEALYSAAEAGVEIDLIIRGICCLVPDRESLGGRIRVRSLVDRFLEHARVYWFHHGGDDRVYLGSADWMQRNLDRRVEVVFPLLDPARADEVRAMIRLQLADTARARVIDADQTNARVVPRSPTVRAQIDQYHHLAARSPGGAAER